MRRALALAALAGALWLVPAAARGFSSPTPWDGTNPFDCVVQQAGLGPAGPDPGADPYCVDFDKRHQSVADGGVVAFLSLEPARVAAASPKCFYFQSDHWRGSVVQDDGTTKTYEWDGHYFFDKAKGDGGVWVTNFNVNGHTFDPSTLPGLPPDEAQHFGPGTGGFITHDDIPADPNCAAKANAPGAHVYASPSQGGGAGGSGAPPASRCVAAGRGAHVTTRGIGPVVVGRREGRLRAALGPPGDVRRGYLRWCVTGGGEVIGGERADRSGDLGSDDAAPMIVVATTSRAFALGGVRVGDRASRVRRAFPRGRARFRIGATTFTWVRPLAHQLVGVRRGRVAMLAVFDRRALRTRRALVPMISRALP